MSNRSSILIASIFLLINFISCKKDDVTAEREVVNVDSVIVSWLDSLGIDSAVRDESGIYLIRETSNPSGSLVSTAGQVLAFYYRIYDLDSVLIDSYTEFDGDSILYKYASNAIFPIGLDLCFTFMRVGESYNFILPPELSYGAIQGVQSTDGTGVFLFNIELVGILSESDIQAEELRQIEQYILDNSLNDTTSVEIDRIDTLFMDDVIVSIDTTFIYTIDSVEYFPNGLRYKSFQDGEGPSADVGDSLSINFEASFLDGNSFSTQSGFDVVLGSGIPAQFISGLEFGLTLFSEQERGLLMMPSSLGYRESALIIPGFIDDELIEKEIIPDYAGLVPPYRTLLFEVVRVD